MTSLPQSRRWCFTSFEEKININTDGVLYYIYQREKAPTTGKLHYQGYIVLERGQRMTYVKKRLNDEKAHIEIAKGNDEQCIAYCSKTESRIEEPVEWGTKPKLVKKQGKRTDLSDVVSWVKEQPGNIDWMDLATKFPAQTARYEAFISKFCKGLTQRSAHSASTSSPRRLVYKTMQRDWMTNIIYIYGKTGSGKTTYVKELKDTYWKNQDNKWWDNYEGQSNVVINEWTCQAIGILELLRLSDHCPLQLEIKGGMVEFLAKTIYITTNISIDDFMTKLEAFPQWKAALLRRITFYEMVNFKLVERKAEAVSNQGSGGTESRKDRTGADAPSPAAPACDRA